MVAAFACGCGRIAFDVQGAPGDGAMHDVAQPDSPLATKLEFTSAAMALDAGVCSQATKVEAQDAAGQPVAVSVAIPLTLTSSSTVAAFFPTAGCSGSGETMIAMGTSSATFYWSDTKKGTPMLEARSTGYTAATQNETIRALAPALIGFESLPVTVTANTCTPGLTVVARDQYGNGTNVTAPTTVSLSSSSGTMVFYGDSACAVTMITSVTIAMNTSTSPMFYFKDSTIGSPVITASSPPLTQAMQTETVN
jgi:hypothetical protein